MPAVSSPRHLLHVARHLVPQMACARRYALNGVSSMQQERIRETWVSSMCLNVNVTQSMPIVRDVTVGKRYPCRVNKALAALRDVRYTCGEFGEAD